jgi:hypothetical protein
MIAGIPSTLASLNQQAGQYALDYRKANRNILDYNNYITSQGGAAFLTGADIQMTPAVANIIVSTYGNLAALATAYMGNGIISIQFNYEENSVPLLGGTWS